MTYEELLQAMLDRVPSDVDKRKVVLFMMH